MTFLATMGAGAGGVGFLADMGAGAGGVGFLADMGAGAAVGSKQMLDCLVGLDIAYT